LAFLEIARYIIDNNESNGEKEQQILQTYAFKMQIDLDKKLTYNNIEELLNIFQKKTSENNIN